MPYLIALSLLYENMFRAWMSLDPSTKLARLETNFNLNVFSFTRSLCTRSQNRKTFPADMVSMFFVVDMPHSKSPSLRALPLFFSHDLSQKKIVSPSTYIMPANIKSHIGFPRRSLRKRSTGFPGQDLTPRWDSGLVPGSHLYMKIHEWNNHYLGWKISSHMQEVAVVVSFR